MNWLVDQPDDLPAAPAAAPRTSPTREVPSGGPQAGAGAPASSNPQPLLVTDEHFRIALNIARMEALDTLYAAAAIRDEKGNPTREAIFAANRILAISIHHDRRANTPVAGAARTPSNLPQGGGPAEGRGGGSCLSSGASSASSTSPSSPRIDINLDIRPPSPRPAPPAPASPNLPQGGGPAAGGGGGSCLSTAPSPSSSYTPQSLNPDDPNDFLELFNSFDDPIEAITSGLNGLMSPEDVAAAIARINANNLARFEQAPAPLNLSPAQSTAESRSAGSTTPTASSDSPAPAHPLTSHESAAAPHDAPDPAPPPGRAPP